MDDGEFSPIDRRDFLRATGAVGVGAALSNLAVADDFEAGAPGAASPTEPAELIVSVSTVDRFDEVEAALPEDATVLGRHYELQFVLVRLPARDGADARLRDQSQIAGHDAVKFTESNQPLPVLTADAGDPNDPDYNRQYAPANVEAPAAWDAVADADGEVTVAVIDSGVDYEHPDLEDQFGAYKGRNVGVSQHFEEEIDWAIERGEEARDGFEEIAGGFEDVEIDTDSPFHVGGWQIDLPGDSEDHVDDFWSDVDEFGDDVGDYWETGGGIPDYDIDIGNEDDDGLRETASDYADSAGEELDDLGDKVEETLFGRQTAAAGITLGDPGPTGGENHGTHVAGTIAATVDNGEGVAGIAGLDGVRLLSYRVFNHDEAMVTPSELASALVSAGRDGADVINMSLGYPVYVPVVKTAIQTAIDRYDALPIAAAGNVNDMPDEIPSALSNAIDKGQDDMWYPATLDDCVAVSGVDDDDDFGSYSKYGDSVDITAPGASVYSTMTGGGYGNMTGTSMATPVTAGVAALTKLQFPDLSADELRSRIEDTAEDIGLPENKQGAGRVNALRAVAAGTETVVRQVNEETVDDSTSERLEHRTHRYWPEDDPVRIEISIEGAVEKADLYVTLDGRIPDDPSRDYDRSGDGDGIVLSGSDIGSKVGIFVYPYGETGDYSLTIEEYAEVVEPEGDGRVAPDDLALDVDRTVEPGRELTFAATDVSGEARWEFDDRTVEGRLVTHSFDETGDHPVRLSVEGSGETVSAAATVTVDPDAHVGHLQQSDVVEGNLDGSRHLVYEPRTPDPGQVSFELTSPGMELADLDLYVTLDGRPPTRSDYDRRAVAPGGSERLLVKDPGEEIGVLVDHVAGDDQFELVAEELGTRL